MAKVYLPPFDMPSAPDLGAFIGADAIGSIDDYFEAMHKWEAVLADECRKRHPGDTLAGYVYRQSVADGKASYMVECSKPLTLWWLDEGDGYALPEPHLRGLRVTDIRRAKRFDEMWAREVAK